MNLRYERKKAEKDYKFSPNTKIIWHPSQVKTYYDRPRNSYCYFRKKIELKKVPKQALIRVFADSRYVLYINGQRVGRGPSRSDPRWKFYDEIAVTEYLAEGENQICALVLYYGYGTGHSMDRIPAFFAQCNMIYSEAKEEIFGTDEEWKVKLAEAFDSGAPRVNGCKGPVEIFNNDKYLHNWLDADFDDSDWEKAAARNVKDSPFWNLVKRPIPMEEETVISAKSIVAAGVGAEAKEYDEIYSGIKAEIKNVELNHVYVLDTKCELNPVDRGVYNYLMVDFDKVMVGYLTLEVEGYAGDIIDVVYADELVGGRPEINERSYRSIARFILKDGENKLEIKFEYEAFRYVMLIFRNHVRSNYLKSVGMISRRYPVAKRSTFSCDNEYLQKLWDISAHTMELCMQDAFLDSPGREQQQWMGDGRYQAIINNYLSGDTRMHKKLLKQIAQSQDMEGMTCSRYPDENHNLAPIPSFCMQWISSFGDYYDYTEDAELIKELWNSIISGLRWFSAFENEDGLLECLPYWSYSDCGEDADGISGEYHKYNVASFYNMQYAEAIETVMRLASVVGDAETEKYMKAKHKKLKKAIMQKLWSDELGAYSDGILNGELACRASESVNAMAILNIHDANDARSAQIVQNVFEPESRGNVVFVSPYFMLPYTKAMKKVGRNRLAMEEFLARYKNMIDCDATSTWEHWNRYYEMDNVKYYYSVCHGWGAAAIVMVAENILGIDLFNKKGIKAEPNVKDFGSLKAEIVTPKGLFNIEIENNEIVKNSVEVNEK